MRGFLLDEVLKAAYVALCCIEISPVHRKMLFASRQQRYRQLANRQCTCYQALVRQLGQEPFASFGYLIPVILRSPLLAQNAGLQIGAFDDKAEFQELEPNALKPTFTIACRHSSR